jgi:hypothetical protein
MNTKNERKPTEKNRDSGSRNWHNLDNRLAIIAEAAYYKSEKRGFQIGHDIEDWLDAEIEMAKIMGES